MAALYVDPRGPYSRLGVVECWDEKRDARLYNGPHPVVAHPPCGPWGQLRHQCTRQPADCGPRAVEQVRAFGGVLEHPAYSTLFQHCAMPGPGDEPDAWGGFTIEVEQVEWGHVARKRTWLYLVGVPRAALTPPPFPGREPTHWVSGTRNLRRRKRWPPSARHRAAPHQDCVGRAAPPLAAHYHVLLRPRCICERPWPPRCPTTEQGRCQP